MTEIEHSGPRTQSPRLPKRAIGVVAPRDVGREILARARARAALLPDLIVEARRVASNVFSGWHGRRKRGIGENFWQFRPYVHGETMAAIDWRRSARDDNIYVKDKEWLAAHTVWIWVDETPSMLFQSKFGTASKQSRALVVALALAELLSRSGERIGWPELLPPFVARNAAERIGMAIAQSPPQDRFPDLVQFRRHSELVLLSDFLDPMEELKARIHEIARRGLRGHLVQIVDPAEQLFPYAGRIDFLDTESGAKLTASNAQSMKLDYERLFAERSRELKRLATRFGWSHNLHRTDAPASRALAALDGAMNAGHRGAM